tara:strand:+ start:207 stop:461 length:255 start_codon:yes stop_codon:yes gene_type:complete
VSSDRDIVTDHAVLRYLERVYGVDVRGLRLRIERVTAEARIQGANAVISDGVKYRFSRSGRVVTIVGCESAVTNRGKRWRAKRK